MRIILVAACFVMATLKTYAQTEEMPYIPIENDAISLEMGKTGLVFNIVYDHLFTGNEFGYRIMAGTNFGGLVSLRSAGIGGYYIRGGYRKFLETGVDLQYFKVKRFPEREGFYTSSVYPDYSTNTFYASANIGYRVYFLRFLFRFGLTAGVTKNDFIPGAYGSAGFTF